MKRLFAICLTVIMLACVLALASCELFPFFSTNSDDTYIGSASEEYYDSEERAITAYLEKELSGNGIEAVYVSHKREKYLSETEISNLKLKEEIRHTIIGAEKLRVEYIEKGQANNKTYSRVFNIIGYDDGSFRYYSMPVEIGETLTASYMKSLFDADKYSNCTFKSNTKLSLIGKSSSETLSAVISIKQDAKLGKDATWYNLSLEQSGFGNDEKMSMETYLWRNEKTSMEAVKIDDEWSVTSSSADGMDVSKIINQAFLMAFDGADACYFEKTADGYQIRTDKIYEWLGAYCGPIVGYDVHIQELLALTTNLKANYKVTLRKDKINELSIDVGFSVFQNGESISFDLSSNTSITNVNITKVSVPKEVLDLV